ncbi:arsenate reductase (glutaredoxin) [Flavobacterium ardleyense]|uniref:Arsenate reductase (Glutaredoxin) n=1 Tax=Flavobacterium ardleyense TaxID=2038737 RepID=A0ABW5Z528_9FLAO
MITIYHNPRCTKSREGLCELENLNKSITVRKYLDEPFTKEELQGVLKKLGIKPLELVRTKEAIWTENYKGKEMSDDAIVDAMLAHPRLIERPIVVFGEKAIVARPTEKINELLSDF